MDSFKFDHLLASDFGLNESERAEWVTWITNDAVNVAKVHRAAGATDRDFAIRNPDGVALMRDALVRGVSEQVRKGAGWSDAMTFPDDVVEGRE